MIYEIEKKFLLKHLPSIDVRRPDSAIRIAQFFRPCEEKNSVDRIRHSIIFNDTSDPDNKTFSYTRTFKKRLENGVSEEVEQELSQQMFSQLAFSGEYTRGLIKTRYIYKDGDLKWEVDKFESVNLIIAEVELPSEDYEFEIPDFLQGCVLIDITDMPEFRNENLSLEAKIKPDEGNFENKPSTIANS